MVYFQYFLVVAFALAGIAKVLKAKPLVEQFQEFKLPHFAIIMVGFLELVGSIGLLVSYLQIYANLGLLALMLGAIGNHLKVKHSLSKLLPSLVLFIMLITFLVLIINNQ